MQSAARKVLHMSDLIPCSSGMQCCTMSYEYAHVPCGMFASVILQQQACQLICQVNAVLVQQLRMITNHKTIALLLCVHACTACGGCTYVTGARCR